MDNDRRLFLKSLAVSGPISASLLERADSAAPENESARKPDGKKTVLIAAEEGALARAIMDTLGQKYLLRRALPVAVQSLGPASGQREAGREWLARVDAVIHCVTPVGLAGLPGQVDYATRSTYDLLRAAMEEGVRHVVCLSSLAMMFSYDEAWQVDEDWRPEPRESAGLAEYLGECVCREFARQGGMDVVVLRLGRVIPAEENAGRPFDPLWVDPRDVAQAVSSALAAQLAPRGPRLGAWSVLHILIGISAGQIPDRACQEIAQLPPRIPKVKTMKVLLLGACGYLGPHVARALAPHHRLCITDVKPAPQKMKEEFAGQEFRTVDVTMAGQVLEAAEGKDAIVNLSVVRTHPALTFQVNTLGCLHVMQAAVRWGIRRVINTGPHFTVAGPSYEGFDFAIGADVPPHPGTQLYPLTKCLGQEICRAFSRTHDVYVQDYLFYSLQDVAELKPGAGGVPFTISWSDAGEVFRLGLAIDLAKLPSRCEVFFLFGDCPQGKFSNDKAKRILGFSPKDDVSVLWKKSNPPGP